jgi:ParB/RepB/Spo0J family partition protein
MTTENTENKVEKKAKKAEPKPAKEPKAPAAAAPSGQFEYEFLPLPEAVATVGHIRIDPKKIMVSKFDARAQPAPVTDDLIASIKENGLIQDPLVTYARSKGGEEGWLIVAGRRRREACQKAGLKEISAKAVEITSFKQYLILAGEENLKRQNMSPWDIYNYFTQLLGAGLKQSEIKEVFHVTDGYVSQYLAIGKLDERVQKHVRAAADEPFKSHAASVVRELKRVGDPEEQVAFAQKAIDEELSPAALKFIIEKWLNKQAQAAEEGEKKAKAGSRAVRLPEEISTSDIKPLPKSDFATLINYARAKHAKAKASEKATPESLAYARGVMDGLLQAAGLKETPAAAAKSSSKED